MNVLIGIAIFVVIALISWAIAEAKPGIFGYNQSEDEQAVEQNAKDALVKNGYDEQNIKDVIKNISTKGFEA